MKKLISLAAAVLTAFALSICANAQAVEKVIDNAGILSESDEQKLTSQVERLILDHGVDAVIYTTDSLDGKELSQYAQDSFVKSGCGIGADGDGILLLISAEEREVFFITHGWANGSGFTDYATERIVELITSDLSQGNYFSACGQWLELSDKFMTASEKGKPYDYSNKYHTSTEYLTAFILCFAASLVIALIVCLIMRGRMKTAVRRSDANDYVSGNSFRVSKQRDIYIYSDITRKKRSDDKPEEQNKKKEEFGGSGGKF